VWRVEPADAAPQPGAPVRAATPTPSLTTVLRRREDQVRLRYEFYNLQLDASGPGDPVLVPKNPNAQCQVVVEFLPQHVMEEALYEHDPDTQTGVDQPPGQDGPDPTSDDPVPPPPLGSRVAGATRLAFTVPPASLPIIYTSAGLLDWSGWTPRVVPVARASTAIQPIDPFQITPHLKEPGPLDTAIELPWWLIISPHVQTGWAHVGSPVSHGLDGVTEVWHTRLAGRPLGGELDEADEARLTVRAVWTRDPGFADYLDDPDTHEPADGEDFDLFPRPLGMPFRTALSPRDRYDLVTSTADYEHAVSKLGYLPEPANVDALMLTALGGWLDVDGAWRAGNQLNGESGTSLESWRHRATGGRDHYVRIVRKGYLFPFGHAASLIKVSERKFKTIGSGGRGDPKRRVAYVFQRYFLVVRQRVRDYGTPGLHRNGGRSFPFTRLRFTTVVTPNLDAPKEVATGLGDTKAFVPKVGGQPFAFHVVGTDKAGRGIDLATPVVFVDTTIAYHAGDMQTLRDEYNDQIAVEGDVRQVDAGGAPIAVAVPAKPGDTTLEVRSLSWGAEEPDPSKTQQQLAEVEQPRFVPTMAEAQIRLAAAEVAVGGGLGAPPTVVFDEKYVTGAFTNKGEVFVRIKDIDNPTGLDFGASSSGDRSGGVITPNVGITALSRKSGTVGGDPEKFQDGAFDPADFFGALDATLLGDITLKDVIEVVTGADFDLSESSQTKDRVVQLTTREEPQAIVTELRWLPKLKDVGDLFIADLGGSDATLEVLASIVTPKAAPTDATFSILGDLKNFQIGLLPGARFLVIEFNRVRFQTQTGTKPDVDIEIREVVFDGPLKFVNQLKDYLTFSAGGFSIELQPTQLRAGFQIPIPAITVGVFSIQNISFGAGVTIPFTGKPIRTRFALCTQENPFLLTVMIFGGGGFFELGLGPDGVESFQAGLEFGGSLALDIGVASGSISLTAGIYLAIGIENPPDNPDGAVEMTGFLKLKGQVEVLGLITVTLLMKASITYFPATEKAIAKAVVIVEIDVTLWSGSVEIEYEKKFGGSDDPTFGQALPQSSMWDAYCDAFAPIGV
ncbi:MAG TPA: hypothetical protein VGA36_12150, partial [Nitriliruptorales bacterium]